MKHSPTDFVFTGLSDRFKDASALQACCDSFCSELQAKLSDKQAEGRSGWADPSWSMEDKLEQLRKHIDKGDMLDVAAFAMFIWNAQDDSLQKS